jgi:plasmid stabilization system protein ParE
MPRARRPIFDACEWWNANRGLSPTLLERELERAIQLLAKNPNIGALRSERKDVRQDVLFRLGILVLYRVRVRSERVEVLSIWHGARAAPARFVR